jgi:hypothetical protein
MKLLKNDKIYQNPLKGLDEEYFLLKIKINNYYF